MALLVALIILGIFGAISGAVASSRGHNFTLFFIIGAIFSPLLAIILCFVIQPPKQDVKYGSKRYNKTGRKTFNQSRDTIGEKSNPIPSRSAFSRRR